MTTTKPVTYNGPIGVRELKSYVDPCPGAHNSDRITMKVKCDRCVDGIYRWWTHMGQAGGTCFKCFGTTVYTYELAAVTVRKNAKQDAYHRDYTDEIRAHFAAQQAIFNAAEAAREFDRAWEDAHKEQARRAAMNNNTIGEIGERLRDLEATIEVSASFERASYAGYGTETVKIIVAKLADGRVIKMMGTGDSLWGLNRGDKVKITGTVKGYGEYKGQTQTILQRAKINVVEPAE